MMEPVAGPTCGGKFLRGAQQAGGTGGGSTAHSHSVSGAGAHAHTSTTQYWLHKHFNLGEAGGELGSGSARAIDLHRQNHNHSLGSDGYHNHGGTLLSTSADPPYYALAFVMRIS